MLKKKIIIKLNKLLNNYNELSALCNILSNDSLVVIKKINKIIQYAFVEKDFVYSDTPLVYILSCADKFDSNIEKNSLDIKGLIVPDLERINEICNDNLSLKQYLDDKQNKLNNFYKEQRFFEEGTFFYSRCELVTVDSNFVYYYKDATCDIVKDFSNLYSSNKYNNGISPLNDLYETNIEIIKNNCDISLIKKGNVYEIENGRHRILYILSNGRREEIPVFLTRRFEDREVNIILDDLIKLHGASIYKNNLLNDDVNVLILLNSNVYLIENKEQLINFYNNLDNGVININLPFNVIDINDDKFYYLDLIFNKYLEVGDKVLISNFTELNKYFDNLNNLYYFAFRKLQFDYQMSLIYKKDFKELYNKRKVYNAVFKDKINCNTYQSFKSKKKQKKKSKVENYEVKKII